MASFTIGNFRFDVISHDRTVADGRVRERFVIDAFYSGTPLSWHPNQTGRDDYPGIPNRTVYEFVGQESVAVEGGGTKRGADFRSRFFRNLVHQAGKARLAARLGQTIADITDADINRNNNPDKDIMRGIFTDPVNLRALTIDTAIARLRQ